MSTFRFTLLSLILFLGAANSLHAAQGIYQWKDKDGTVQYADHPPEGVDAVFIKSSRSKTSKAKESAEEMTETSASQTKTHDKMEVLPEKDPKLCKQATNNLKALEGARIRITDTDGSQRFLTEVEKEAQRENARKFIKLHCD